MRKERFDMDLIQSMITEPLAFLDQTVYRVLAVLIGL